MIATLLACFALMNLSTTPLWVLMPTFVKGLGAGAEGMAVLGSAMAAGGLAGAALAGFLPDIRRKGLLIAGSLLVAMVPFVAIVLAPSLYWAAAWMVPWGLLGPWVQVNVNVTFQRLVPPDLQGRVFAVRFFIARSLTPLGAALAGVLAATFGLQPVLLAGALLGVAGAVGALLVREVRELVV